MNICLSDHDQRAWFVFAKRPDVDERQVIEEANNIPYLTQGLASTLRSQLTEIYEHVTDIMHVLQVQNDGMSCRWKQRNYLDPGQLM